MAKLLLAAPLAEQLNESLTHRISALAQDGVTPTLAILRMGERADDVFYERALSRLAEKLHIRLERHALAADAPQAELLNTLNSIVNRMDVHGLLVMRPLPKHIDEAAALSLIPPRMDVDGATLGSLALLLANRQGGFAPCTAQACVELLRHYGYIQSGKRAVVVGRSLVIGKPVGLLLLNADMSVSFAHSRSADLPAITRDSDVLIVAAGVKGLIGREHVRAGQAVIDVGVHPQEDGSVCGDVRFEEVEPIVEAISPVRGGIGSITSRLLLEHVVASAELALCK